MLSSHGENQALAALLPRYEPGSLGYALRSFVISIREEFDSFDRERLERPARHRANRLRRCSATASWRCEPVHYFSPTGFRLADDKRNIAEQAAGGRITDGNAIDIESDGAGCTPIQRDPDHDDYAIVRIRPINPPNNEFQVMVHVASDGAAGLRIVGIRRL